MKKKFIGVLISLSLIAAASLPAFAETITGGKDWNVYFTPEEEMVSTFKSSEMTESISGMQPGDTAVFTVDLGNKNSTTTDWYMTNKVLYSLEDRSNNKSTRYFYS